MRFLGQETATERVHIMQTHRSLRSLALSAALLICTMLATGCAGMDSESVVQTPPPVAPIVLNVSEIRFLHQLPRMAPDSSFGMALADSAQRWMMDNIRASGMDGRVTVLLRDARLSGKIHIIPSDDWFIGDRRRLSAEARVKLSVIADVPDRRYNGFVDVEVDRAVGMNLADDVSDAEAMNQASDRLLQDIMPDIDVRLRDGIATHLSPLRM